ncbi:hypothetical protein FACS1894172_18350 [Spirochaetia bacterium]|nr:hypothetical protein FACS1894172_18350 [Spirochaetia bacterium]
MFDLIICDEAHRTTGLTLANDEESAFVKVHDSNFIKAKKRLYMTATPRLYSDDSKSKAAQVDAVLCSMDDEAIYGQEIYRIGFGKAVAEGLLTDYKVLILTLNESEVPKAVQQCISDKTNEIKSDDASKLIGCINALSKQILGDEGSVKGTDPALMRRAVAFCPRIRDSKTISGAFNEAGKAYIDALSEEKRAEMVQVSSKHIDGTMNAPKRDELLSWLKEQPADGECRVLTNVRCLSEGVDVPSLDAVMFLSARNSQVDVVQSVGRVMRTSPGKKYGYIIIPVVVPAAVDAKTALDDNEHYKVVWTVLNALRAHDDRFNATVNKIELNRKKPDNIIIGRPPATFDKNGESVAESEPAYDNNTRNELARQMMLQFADLQSVIFARMVQKVGDRLYWEQWAKEVAQIAEREIKRITSFVARNGEHTKIFEQFLAGLRKNINSSISAQEAIEMLSQHIITKPVFEALFEGYSFVKNNPISLAMQNMLDVLENQAIEKDTAVLQKFYDSVKMRASGIDNAEGRQQIIIELYDKFFKTAFPKMVERLGIVYTPVEVVDFIIHSVDDVLKKEFGRSLSDENVNILDPFTGTGTFITRLLQSGLIRQEDLSRKYEKEIYANEIVLLAYYIAAVNIENAYHEVIMGYGVESVGHGVEGVGHGVESVGYGVESVGYGGRINDTNISGIDSLAGSDESCRDYLPTNKEFPERGNVRTDKPDEESRSFDSIEHSGRVWEKNKTGLSTISLDSERISTGVRDTGVDSKESTNFERTGNGKDTSAIKFCGAAIDGITKVIELDNAITPHPTPYTPYSYTPFQGICLTDTFQLGETEEGNVLFSELFKQNSERVEKQRKNPITVIMGNPPYSIGQTSANDNAQNQSYPTLEKHIADSYVKSSNANLSKGVYDSYIKAFRWSTDRLPPSGGVVCFVSNGAWLDSNAMDGFRKCLEKDFSSIYVFNLRGNARTSGEQRRKEAGNVFDSGSRTPIAITLLVKNPDSTAEKAVIHYRDIGDYLTREQKLETVKNFTSIANITWTTLTPNEHGDWIAQRNDIFSTLIPLAPEKKFDTNTQSFFSTLAIGVATNRDTWSYNFSEQALSSNMQRMIAFYNEQQAAYATAKKENPNLTIEDFINTDATKISWTVNLKKDANGNIAHKFNENCTISGLYRPFCKQNLYYDRHFIERPGIWQQLFPTPSHKNLVICVSGMGANKENCLFISDTIVDLNFLSAGAQCFPLYYYEEQKDKPRSLFDESTQYTRRDGISDFILAQAHTRYGKTVTKEDIFYYVYGFLHSPDYRTKFANDLKKMLPRLPLVDTPKDFWTFSKAGRALADLHLNYETVPPYPDVKVGYRDEGMGYSDEGIGYSDEGIGYSDESMGYSDEDMGYKDEDMGYRENTTLPPYPLNPMPHTLFTVEKMRFPAKDKKDTIIYNSRIMVSNIPAKAYEYVVNGKSAIEWIMDRYQVKIDKDSGIKNDPNDWAAEHEKSRYILDLLLSVINVSVQTVDIVATLPKVEFN